MTTTALWRGRLCLALFLSASPLLIAPAAAQTAAPDPTPQEQKQATDQQKIKNNDKKTGLLIDAGYLFRPRRTDEEKKTLAKEERYYRVEYNGTKVSEKGSAFNLPVFAQTVDAPKTPTGTPPELLLRFENGAGEGTGPLAELFGASPLRPKADSYLARVRGAAQLYGRWGDKKLSAAVGLEAPPVPPLALLGKNYRSFGVTNWFVPGIQAAAEAVSADASGKARARDNEDRGLATYRGYLGFGAGYVQSDSARRVREKFSGLFADGPLTYSDILNLIQGLAAAGKDAAATPAGPRITQQEADAISGAVQKIAPAGGDPLRTGVDKLLKPFVAAPGDPAEARRKALAKKYADLEGDLKDAEKPVLKEKLLALDALYGAQIAVLKGDADRPEIEGGVRIGQFSVSDWEFDGSAGLIIVRTPPATGDALNDATLRRVRKALGLAGAPPEVDNVDGLASGPDSAALRRRLADALNQVITLPDFFDDPAILAGINALTAPGPANNPPGDLFRAEVKPLAESRSDVSRGYAVRLLMERAFGPALRGVSATLPNRAPSVWPHKLQAFISDAFLLPDRPTYQFALEGVGQYIAFGKVPSSEGTRFRNLIGVTATFYLNPAADKTNWVRLRYENGRDRAAPTVYRNALIATVGFQL